MSIGLVFRNMAEELADRRFPLRQPSVCVQYRLPKAPSPSLDGPFEIRSCLNCCLITKNVLSVLGETKKKGRQCQFVVVATFGQQADRYRTRFNVAMDRSDLAARYFFRNALTLRLSWYGATFFHNNHCRRCSALFLSVCRKGLALLQSVKFLRLGCAIITSAFGTNHIG
jgi:hypothetical protein